jgi:thymidylate kinase
MLIAICGIDGTGKTVLARQLARRSGGLYRKQTAGPLFDRALKDMGTDVLDHLPSTEGQRLAEAYACDFTAYAHRYGLLPATAGRVVVVDRWRTCVEVFARVFALQPGTPVECVSEVPMPHLEILLDLDPRRALERISRRGAPDWDETPELLGRLKTGYVDASRGRDAVAILDASLPAEDVATAAWSMVASLLHSVRATEDPPIFGSSAVT